MVSLVKKYMKRRNEQKLLPASIQLLFLKRLHRLLTRGYSLLEALDVLAWDDEMARFIDKIKQALYSGHYLDEALTEANFHQMIVVYIYFVRVNGDLLTSLSKSIDMFEQRMKAFEKFKKISRYPLFLLMIFILLLFLIKQFILPAYVDMFQFHTESASTVQFTFTMFNSLFTLFIGVIIIFFIVYLFWNYWKEKIPIEKQLHLFSYIPIYRKYIAQQTSFYFATQVSLFLKTGMSMKQIIEHLQSQKELPIVQYYASIMMSHLEKGYYLDQLLANLPFIDSQLALIFQQHNHIEALEKDLATYADFISESLEQKTMQFITYIQPISFSFLGLFIIVVYFSLLWPMFQLIESI